MLWGRGLAAELTRGFIDERASGRCRSRLHIMIDIAYIGALNQDPGVVVVTTGDNIANNFQTNIKQGGSGF